MRSRLTAATTALLLITAAGCGAPESGTETETELVSSAITLGNWSDILSNGSLGPDPFGGIPAFCEVFVVNDNRFHAGKVWDGQCRFEWGGSSVIYSHNYRVLQNPTSGSLAFRGNPGFTPGNAVATHPTSTDLGIPVCTAGAGHPGKVWNGTCRFEYGNTIRTTTAFSFVVHNP